MPFNYSIPDARPWFDAPGSLWRTNTSVHVEVVGATTYVNPDLHQANHLYAKLQTTAATQSLAMFKQDPSLLKVVSREDLTVTNMVFGTCPIEVIRYVLAHGGNPKASTTRGSTIMHTAAMNAYPGVLDLALRLGGKVNAKTKNGRTPLIKAILSDQPACWQWLLKHGADPSEESAEAGTPAGWAIDYVRPTALADLVKAGAKPLRRDRFGHGWLDYAVSRPVMLDQVAKFGVPVNGRNPRTGSTPLISAVQSSSVDGEIWMIRHGANPSLKDRRGKTAFDYARASNTLHTDEFFRQRLAKYGKSH